MAANNPGKPTQPTPSTKPAAKPAQPAPAPKQGAPATKNPPQNPKR